MMSKPAAVTSGHQKTAVELFYTAPDNDVVCLFVPGDDERDGHGRQFFLQMAYAEFCHVPAAGLILRKKRLSKLSHPSRLRTPLWRV